MTIEQIATRGSSSKLGIMIFLLLIDLGLNSSLDYDSFNTSMSSGNLLAFLAAQIIVQIVIFLVLFLAMADTFLFRVGLLGLLLKKFRFILCIHPIYLALTIGAGVYRIQHGGSSQSLVELWTSSGFNFLSDIQKIGESTFRHHYSFDKVAIMLTAAVIYYLLNIRATIKLGSPLYVNKDEWIALIKEVIIIRLYCFDR